MRKDEAAGGGGYSPVEFAFWPWLGTGTVKAEATAQRAGRRLCAQFESASIYSGLGQTMRRVVKARSEELARINY